MKNSIFPLAAMAALACMFAGCSPSDGTKELDMGRKAYEVRDLKKAEKLFAKCVELSPDNPDALLYLARLKLDAGELEEAKKWIARAEAVAGEDVDVKLVAGEIAWHAKDYEKASAQFRSVADDTSLTNSLRAQGWTGLGIVEASKEHKHLARVAFMRAILLDRHTAAARYQLGLLYRDAFGYCEAALEQFEIFVRLEVAASPRVQKVQRAFIPDLKEQIAHETANRPGVSKRDSAACTAALAKAEAEFKKGNFRNARESYQTAFNLDPLSYPAALGLAKAVAKTDSTASGLQKAFNSYKIACELRPGAIQTFLTTGELAAKLGRHAAAVEIFSRAVAASPRSIQAIDGLIRALTASNPRGNKADAQAYQQYRNALTASPK